MVGRNFQHANRRFVSDVMKREQTFRLNREDISNMVRLYLKYAYNVDIKEGSTISLATAGQILRVSITTDMERFEGKPADELEQMIDETIKDL